MLSIVFFAFIILTLMLYLICRKCSLSGKNKERLQKAKDKIFFNTMIRFVFLGSLKLNFTAFTAVKNFTEISTSSKIVGILTLVLINMLPIIFFAILYRNSDRLDEKTSHTSYGTMYLGRNVDENRNHKAHLYPIIFFGRRFVFIVMTVFLQAYPII